MSRRALGAALTAAVLMLPACEAGSSDHSAEDATAADLLTVTGRLTGTGVECPAFQGDDGRLYTLTGDLTGELDGAQPGDRLRVTGRIAEMSICMQGTTLTLVSVDRL